MSKEVSKDAQLVTIRPPRNLHQYELRFVCRNHIIDAILHVEGGDLNEVLHWHTIWAKTHDHLAKDTA
jgi:hypothetical protein